jgi:hypothetical protein
MNLDIAFELKVISEDDHDVLVLSDELKATLKTTAALYHGISFFSIEDTIRELATEAGVTTLTVDPECIPMGKLRNLTLAVVEWFFKDRRNGVDFNSIAWQYAQLRRLEKSIAAKLEIGI